ncbi:MAG: hypothetical protein AAF674_11335 [Pseudomonadota bacterium]
MQTVTIEEVRCIDNEDWLENQDEIHIDGIADGARAVRVSKDMKKGQRWAPNRSFRFNRGGTLQLWERDPFSRKDLLGQVHVRNPGRFRAPFKRQGYHYEVTYSVSARPSTSGFFDRFVPSRHGFNFGNSFSAREVTEELTIGTLPQPFRGWLRNFGNGDWGPAGLCGGISSAIADYYFARRRVPSTTTIPGRGSAMFDYLVDRQMDTFKPGVNYALKFIQWMFMDKNLVRAETLKEARDLKRRLDRKELPVLGLLRVHGAANPSLNHQVLAYDYTGSPESVMRVKLCEPNYVDHDHIVLEIRKRRLEITLELARRLDKDLRRMNLPMPDWLEDLVANVLKAFSHFADGALPNWAKKIVVHRMDVATCRMVETRAPRSGVQRVEADDKRCYGMFVMPYRRKTPRG